MKRTLVTLVMVFALWATVLMWPNNRSGSQSARSGLEGIIPTAKCQDRDPYAKCQTKCFNESELVYAQCMVVWDDQAKCEKQAHDYEVNCQTQGGCP